METYRGRFTDKNQESVTPEKIQPSGDKDKNQWPEYEDVQEEDYK